MMGILYGIYQLPTLTIFEFPIVTQLLNQFHILGLLIACVAFLGANLFLQVPISVLGVLLSNEREFAAIAPYPTEKITQDFTLAGFRVDKIIKIDPVPSQK